MKRIIIDSLIFFTIFSLITGAIYPLLITGIGKILFPEKVEGSIIYRGGKPVGSDLLGQSFTAEKYFHSRPSVINYNPIPSGASNLGLSSRQLSDSISEGKKRFVALNNLASDLVLPSEMLFNSGSGVDPHISRQGAIMQVERIGSIRNLKRSKIIELINQCTEQRKLGIFGEEVVNVLRLNLKLDEITDE